MHSSISFLAVTLLLSYPPKAIALPLPSLAHVLRLDVSDLITPINFTFPGTGSLPHVSIPDIGVGLASTAKHINLGITDVIGKSENVASGSSQMHLLTTPLLSSTSQIGPLALLEIFQATFFRILELGFWRGVIGSIAIFWLCILLTFVAVFAIGIYLQRREGAYAYAGAPRREVKYECNEDRVFFTRQRPSQRRVRMMMEGRRDGIRSALWTNQRERVSSGGKSVRWQDEITELERQRDLGLIKTETRCAMCVPEAENGNAQCGGGGLLAKLD